MSLIARVKERLDILEVVGSRVQLKRRGKSWVGLCPFHDEKTPSFSVTPQDGRYYCYGCHAKGDAIQFLADIDGKTVSEVLRELSGDMGISVHNSPENDRQRELVEVNRRAVAWFKKNLARRPDILQYLRNRGLTDETIASFDLGYAPDGNALREAGRDKRNELIEVGLIGNGKWGVYDTFRDRLVIPIRDEAGRTVGFSGRSMSGQNPKYLNTRETVLFKKRDILFNMNVARRGKQVAVVEGYFDAIALHQAGVPAVALMSANASDRQVRSLSRFDGVSVVLDNDAAGQAGAESLIGQLSGGDFLLQTICPETDVADFFAGGGTASEFSALAMSVPEFRLSRISKGRPFEAISYEIVREIEAVADPMLQTRCISRVAETLSDGDESLRRRYARAIDRMVGKPKLKNGAAIAVEEAPVSDPTREELATNLRETMVSYREAMTRFAASSRRDSDYQLAKNELESIKKEVDSIKARLFNTYI